MEKTIGAAVLGVLALGGVEPPDREPAVVAPFIVKRPSTAELATLPGGIRNLVLHAFGTRQPGPNQLRIPVPADGATYEVIIERPGVPRAIPVDD